MSYLCYLIGNGTRTYVGITNNFTRRLRQHNKEIKGGARFTSMHFKVERPWRPIGFIKGIETKGEAMSIERYIKNQRKRGSQDRSDIMRKALDHYRKTKGVAWYWEAK